MKIHISIFFLLLIISCKEEISVDTPHVVDLLVVEGEVSSEQGSSYVKLSTNTSINGLGENALGKGAFVEILDNSGNSYLLKETSSAGLYKPEDDFKGTIGVSYMVHIVLHNGDEYQSDFDEVSLPVGLISSKAEYEEEIIEIDKFNSRTNAFYQLELILSNPEMPKYFKVDTKGYSEQFVGHPDCFRKCPWPDDFDFRLSCWRIIERIGNDIFIGSNQNIVGDSFSYNANRVGLDSKGRFVGEIKLSSLSADSFLYWKKLTSQLNQKGTMFDPPFQPIQGNINPVNHSNRALGHFQAVSITTGVFCINRSGIKITYDLFVANYPEPLCIDIHAPAIEDLPLNLMECFN
jgi:hypothetical protein